MLEHTEDLVKAQLTVNGKLDYRRLQDFPALVMPELQDTSRNQVAQAGSIESVSIRGRELHYRFVPDTSVAPIPSKDISAIAASLQIDKAGWEFSRTHWAVKDVDLYYTLLTRDIVPRVLRPTVFDIPSGPPSRDLVSVMMPFSAEFAPVYRTLSTAVEAVGWRCQRADDIWKNDAIIQDVVGLIAESQIVICDLSGRNANVFYEAGIAHAIGRPVVLLAQHPDDVPFDLRHLRYVKYQPNSQGLAELAKDVMPRLQTLMRS